MQAQLGLKGRILPGRLVGRAQLLQRRHQRLRHEHAAIGAEVAGGVRQTEVAVERTWEELSRKRRIITIRLTGNERQVVLGGASPVNRSTASMMPSLISRALRAWRARTASARRAPENSFLSSLGASVTPSV